jgi:hypothetical protein
MRRVSALLARPGFSPVPSVLPAPGHLFGDYPSLLSRTTPTPVAHAWQRLRHGGHPPSADPSGIQSAIADSGAKLTYERLTGERDRLRAARAFFARQLGPLPAFAGISVAAVGAFSNKATTNNIWLYLALAAFGAMVLVSIAYSRMPSYRELRSDRLDKTDAIQKSGADDATKTNPLKGGSPDDTTDRWYAAEVQLEEDIYLGDSARGFFWWSPRRHLESNMQTQMDKERFGGFAVQILFLMVVVFLVLAHWS